jgi:DNA-binding transcriptional LysR family regulator
MCLDFPVTSGVSRKRLGTVDALCAMPDGHRLAQQQQVKLEDLEGESIIEWLPISPFVGSDEHALLERHHITNTSVLRTQTAHTRYALIAAGLGVSITEPFTAKNWRSLGVSTRPITPTVPFDYIVAYQKSMEHSELIQTVISTIQTIYEQYTAKMHEA